MASLDSLTSKHPARRFLSDPSVPTELDLINTLPLDVIRLIFLNLSLESFNGVKSVCRRWHKEYKRWSFIHNIKERSTRFFSTHTPIQSCLLSISSSTKVNPLVDQAIGTMFLWAQVRPELAKEELALVDQAMKKRPELKLNSYYMAQYAALCLSDKGRDRVLCSNSLTRSDDRSYFKKLGRSLGFKQANECPPLSKNLMFLYNLASFNPDSFWNLNRVDRIRLGAEIERNRILNEFMQIPGAGEIYQNCIPEVRLEVLRILRVNAVSPKALSDILSSISRLDSMGDFYNRVCRTYEAKGDISSLKLFKEKFLNNVGRETALEVAIEANTIRCSHVSKLRSNYIYKISTLAVPILLLSGLGYVFIQYPMQSNTAQIFGIVFLASIIFASKTLHETFIFDDYLVSEETRLNLI